MKGLTGGTNRVGQQLRDSLVATKSTALTFAKSL